MQTNRRAHGRGSLTLRPNRHGGENWIAFWRVDGRGVMRSLGPKRSKVHPDGLTSDAAEREFNRLRDESKVNPARTQRHAMRDVGDSLLVAMRAAGRRPATIDNVDSALRIHIVPFFTTTPVHKIDKQQVEQFVEELQSKELSPKSIRNLLVNLHSLIEHALSEGWRTGDNPVKRVPKPRKVTVDDDLRFLTVEQVEALVRAVPSDELGRIEGPMYLTAAMTGLRQESYSACGGVTWTSRLV
jgi:integrase